MHQTYEERQEELARKLFQKRAEICENQDLNPYLDYETIDDAINDCKYSSQVEVLARMIDKQNVFISGLAGSGKTTIIKKFVELMDAEHNGEMNIALTASTGVAATLIGGTTIHSWAGLGISNEPFNPKEITGTMYSRKKRIMELDTLIIDEISMLPAHIFIKLDELFRFFRKNETPFGGVQIILIGDFLQLPPVANKSNRNVDNRFCIQTDLWKSEELDIKYLFMDKTHRATDEKLKKTLMMISSNKMNEKAKNLVESRVGVSKDPNKTYTTLFTTNKNVDKYNKELFDANPNPEMIYECSWYDTNEDNKEKLLKTQNVPEKLSLKVGATVMLTKNILSGGTVSRANGSIGVVEEVNSGFVNVRFNDGKTEPIYKEEYTMREKVVLETTVMENGTPVVKPVAYEKTIAECYQIPLKLGYAITVHKSQGQTFDGVELDLSKCFQEGLGYVALSRVASFDDMVISKINDKAYLVSELAMKISKYVRLQSKKNREDFVDNIEYYDSLLSSSYIRKLKRLI